MKTDWRNSVLVAAILFVAAVAACRSGAKQQVAAGDDELVWTTRYYPTGKRGTSGLRLDRGMPREVLSGERYDYVIRVVNVSGFALADVAVYDTLPHGFEVADGTAKATNSDGRVAWRLGAMQAGGVVTLRASGVAGDPGEARHVAYATYSVPLTAVMKVVAPKLKLERTVPHIVIFGANFPISYVITNEGNGTATDVVIEEALPDGYVAGDGGRVVRLEVGDLAPGASRELEVAVTPGATGPYQGSAKATATGAKLVKSAATTVRIVVPTLQLSASAPDRAGVGDSYLLSIKVVNTGDGPADDTVVQFTMPPGTSYMGAADDGQASQVVAGIRSLTWEAGMLAPGADKTVVLRMRGDSVGDHVFSGFVEAFGSAGSECSVRVELYGVPVITIELDGLADTVRVGDNATYLVTVRNAGTAVAANVRLVCTLDEDVVFVESQGASAGKVDNGTITFEPVAQLAAGEAATWHVVVACAKPGSRKLLAEVKIDGAIGTTADEDDDETLFSES